LRELRPKDRGLIVASVEDEQPVAEIARVFGLPSAAAARMAVTRAIHRLMRKLNRLK
jgi:DNA-directed RNA polymerase specialized sigma24 family protein